MAQHDYVIANGTGAAVRSDLNNALAAIVSQNSGATEPATTYAFQFWADTTTSTLKLRNSANNAWIELLQLDGTLTMEDGTEALPGLAFRSDLDTGVWRPGTNSLAISTNAVERVEFGASEVVFNDGGANYDFRVEGDTNANLLFVDASADAVGIGSSTPQDSLQAPNARFTVFSAGGSSGSTFDNGVRILSGDGGPGNRPSIQISGGGTAGLSNKSFRTYYDNGGTESLYFTYQGGAYFGAAVGIGVTSPTQALEVAGSIRLNNDLLVADATATRGRIYGDSTGLVVRADTGLQLRFHADAQEKARIDTSGRLLVGTSTSASAGDAQYAKLQVQGNTNNNAGSAIFALLRGEAATSITSGESIGLLQFADSSGNPFGYIQCVADGNAGSGDYPGRIEFSVTRDGQASPTEALRITNGGAISCGPQVSGADLVGTEACGFAADGTFAPVYKIKSALTSSKYAALFFNGNGQVGNILMSGSSTAYNTSSDYRLKENIIAVTDGITRLQQLKPSRFNFIADPDKTVDGFIAHEVQTVVPEAIHGTKDEVDDDGNPVYQGIDQSKLVPLLTAALQEAIGEIEALKARVAALEAS